MRQRSQKCPTEDNPRRRSGVARSVRFVSHTRSRYRGSVRNGVLAIALLVSACGFRITGGTADDDGGVSDSTVDGTRADAPTIDTPIDAAACPLTWPLTFGASRYYIGDEKTFDDAQTYCANNGGRLAIVETAGENTFLANTLATTIGTTTWSWIGLSDRTTEGVDVWVDGIAVNGADYTNYNPKIGDATDCYDFLKNPNGGKWGDWYCNDPHTFVCECDPDRPFP